MRGQDKTSSVTEEESINSAWALFLLCYNNNGKFQTLLQKCAVSDKCIMYLFIYFVVKDLNLVILVLQVFVFSSILVTLIQWQC